MENICPKCNANLQGAPIPQESIDKGWYGTSTHFSRKIGIEISGVYDGVLYWQCPDCGWAWHRFPQDDSRRSLRAQEYIDRQNGS